MNKEINFNDCTLAAIRIRGPAKIREKIENTMIRLKITSKNHCVLIKNTPDNVGMLKKCKDYITWGTIDEETKSALIDKRAQKDGEGKIIKKYFRLHPPIGGFERKGIKKPFAIGGVLGNRKEKINDLIKKML